MVLIVVFVVIRSSLLAIYCRLLFVGCWLVALLLLVVRCVLCVVFLLVVRYSLFVLFVVCCCLLVGGWCFGVWCLVFGLW